MFSENEIVGGIYQIIRPIGEGGIGVIYLAYHTRLRKYVVLKKIKDNFSGSVEARNEVDILKKLHHTYLPQVYDFYQLGSQVFSVIDYIDGYDLEWYLTNNYTFDEQLLCKWLRQLCDVVSYLHSQNPPILHSDIKPANIIVTKDNNICLIDFNISLDLTEKDTINGFSRYYASPEQYIKYCQLTTGAYLDLNYPIDEKTDIYGIGTTFYSLMSHHLPDVISGQPDIASLNLGYSEGFTSIISKAMNKDYYQRYTKVSDITADLINIRKLEKGYKRFFMGQVCSLIIGGALIVGGVALTVHGNAVRNDENFRKDYQTLTSLYEHNATTQVQAYGTDIVNNSEYESIFKENPQYKADVFYCMAKAYFNDDLFEKAMPVYALAINNSQTDESKTGLYRDYAICLMKTGQNQQAQDIISSAQQYGFSNSQTILLKAESMYAQGNVSEYESIIADVSGLISRNELADDDLYEGYILLSQVYTSKGNFENAVNTLNSAQQKYTSNSLKRRLADLYFSAAQQSDENMKKTYLLGAKVNYFSLYSNSTATRTDMINLGYVYNQIADYSGEYIQFLDTALTQYPDEFRFFMLRALFYYKTGDMTGFKNDYQTSCAIYNKLSDKEKDAVTENERKLLAEEKEICDKLNGGV